MGNIFLVWMLTGLWHGAAWNFVLWGLFFALLLILEKVWLKAHLERHPVAGHLYVLFAVLLGFVLFDGASLRETADHVRGLFAFGQLPLISSEAVYALRSYGLVLLMAGIGATPFPHKLVTGITGTEMGKKLQTVLEPLALCILLLTVTAYLVDGSFNPFLYFRF
jgi:alginate O-acetyltransferase complex protein AlgI